MWTDGTINAKEAVSLAARIMNEHLNLFVTLSQEAMDAEIMVEKDDKGKEKAQMCIRDRCNGEVRPALYYSEQEQRLVGTEIRESEATVRSKMRSKELYPQG